MISIKKAEQLIHSKASTWEGNCHTVASELLKTNTKELKGGKLLYGMWHGPIHPKSIFAGRPFTHHGWIRMPDATIVDPTRWAFEYVKPYIYHGENDFYDAGGQRLKLAMRGECPDFTGQHPIPAPQGKLREIIQSVCQDKIGEQICASQKFYIANTPPILLGDSKKELHSWLLENNCGVFIPMDFRD